MSKGKSKRPPPSICSSARKVGGGSSKKPCRNSSRKGRRRNNSRGWWRLSGTAGPPTLYDNLSQIRKDYEKSLEAYHAERTRIINMAMVICFIVGLGLLLLVLMLGILRMVRGFGFWLPALGATACCVIIASMTLAPSRFNLQKFQAVAFLPYHAETPDRNGDRVNAKLAELKKLPESPERESNFRNFRTDLSIGKNRMHCHKSGDNDPEMLFDLEQQLEDLGEDGVLVLNGAKATK